MNPTQAALVAVADAPRDRGDMPLYERIEQALRACIQEGALPPHAAVPSYRELCELTGASRITIRRAISDLCDEGVLYTLPGKGIFVAGAEREFEMAPFVGMTDEFAQRSQLVTSTWLERTIIGAPVHLAALLAVEVGAEVIKLSRVRASEGAPVAIQTVYLTHAICPGLLDRSLVDGSLYRTLLQVYGVRLVQARTTLYARIADVHERTLLKVSHPAPLLCTRQLTFSDAGRPVEWTLSAFRADRYELSMSHEHALVPGRRVDME